MENSNVTVEATVEASNYSKVKSIWLSLATTWVVGLTTISQSFADFTWNSVVNSTDLATAWDSVTTWTMMIVATLTTCWGFLLQKYFGKKIIHVIERIFTR